MEKSKVSVKNIYSQPAAKVIAKDASKAKPIKEEKKKAPTGSLSAKNSKAGKIAGIKKEEKKEIIEEFKEPFTSLVGLSKEYKEFSEEAKYNDLTGKICKIIGPYLQPGYTGPCEETKLGVGEYKYDID